MRILSRAPNSILWLVADSDQVKENLSVQAEYHGVQRSRLFFAGRVGPDAYLARYHSADLFLDTLPFNAGTTASDALWAGLPLLTCVGKTFAARMAGSLLQAVELPELITYNLQNYEDKAVELANSPERISTMKKHLADTHLSCALFDTPSFVRNLEKVWLTIINQYLTTECNVSRPVAADLTNAAAVLDNKEKNIGTKSLDIGCGQKPRNFFNADEVFGLDERDNLDLAIYRVDLAIEPIPFPNETFDFVTAHDLMEYIPRLLYVPHRRYAFIELMNEVWRILKFGGMFMSITSTASQTLNLCDPVRVNIVNEETYNIYFDNINRVAKIYGFIGAFEIIHQKRTSDCLTSLLKKCAIPLTKNSCNRLAPCPVRSC